MNREIRKNPAFKISLAYFVVPFMIGLSYIVKVFFIEGCYAFEGNDEVAHTFIEIELAWKMLKEGSLPFINLFNNFGTPMIGDPVINPFALHSIPYLIFQAPVAATIDRFLMISLSISVLTFLYHRYFSLSLLVSSISAILVVTLPVFNHFSVHHAHQGSILYFTAILIMQNQFRINPNVRNLVGLYISLLIFACGVGINAFFFGLPFLFANQYFVSDAKIDKHFVVFSLFVISLFIFFYPHFSSFFKWSSLAARASLDYAQLLPFTLKRLITDVIVFGARPDLIHVSRGVYYSLPVMVFAAQGLFRINGKKELLRILILGIMPFIIVMFLLIRGDIKSIIPILKPVDITRVLWFSNIFLAVSVGNELQEIKENGVSKAVGTVLIALLLFSLRKFDAFFITGLIFVGIIAMAMAGLKEINQQRLFPLKIYLYIFFNRKNGKLYFSLAFLTLMFSFGDVYNHYGGNILNDVLEKSKLHCGGLGYNRKYFAEFHPSEYLEKIRPFSRVAVEFEPVAYPYLQLVAKRNIFGSNGRSVILHGGFKKYLLENNLVKEGWYHMTYYFKSSNIDDLSSLGIKYVIASSPYGFSHIFWERRNMLPPPYIESYNWQISRAYLYENVRDVDVGYLMSGKEIEYLHDISFKGNSISVEIPNVRKEADLVLTFINWPGWKVSVDGRPEKILNSVDYFLRVNVRPGDKSAIFYFEPFNKQQIRVFVIASIMLFLVTIMVFAKIFRRPDRRS